MTNWMGGIWVKHTNVPFNTKESRWLGETLQVIWNLNHVSMGDIRFNLSHVNTQQHKNVSKYAVKYTNQKVDYNNILCGVSFLGSNLWKGTFCTTAGNSLNTSTRGRQSCWSISVTKGLLCQMLRVMDFKTLCLDLNWLLVFQGSFRISSLPYQVP